MRYRPSLNPLWSFQNLQMKRRGVSSIFEECILVHVLTLSDVSNGCIQQHSFYTFYIFLHMKIKCYTGISTLKNTCKIEHLIWFSGIPIVLLKFSLPQPEADMSLVSPIIVSMFTPVPMISLIILYEIYKR